MAEPAREPEQSLPDGELRFLRGVIHAPPPERLPRGHHDLSPEYVAEHQRLRILSATTKTVSERGYADTTVGQIVKNARVSRRTFYQHFETKDHAFLATFGASVECLAAAVRDAYTSGEREWEDRVAGALAEFTRLLVDWPDTGVITFVEVGAAGLEAQSRRADATAMVATALRFACAERDPEAAPPAPVAAEMVVGGLFELVRSRMADRRPEALARELPDVTRVLLGPLVGERAAADVARRVADRSEAPETTPAREARS
jgi:AcrR family transcriptional regulator